MTKQSSSKNIQFAPMVPSKHKLTASVREIAEWATLGGSLVGSGFFWADNAHLMGIQQQKQIQTDRPKGYKREVAIKGNWVGEHLQIEVSGRMDGLFHQHGLETIEEIKTIVRDPDKLPEDGPDMFWAQLYLYGYFYAAENDLDKLRLLLTCEQQKSRKSRIWEKIVSSTEINEYVTLYFKEFERWMVKRGGWVTRRNQSLRDLQFPFATYRRGQRDMAVSVYRSIRDSKDGAFEAPTGIGKSLAAIFPALKAMSDDHCDRIFYLTARNTGQSAALSSLDTFGHGLFQLKSVQISAKSKVCFQAEDPLNCGACPYGDGYFDRIKTGLEELEMVDLFNRQTIEILSKKHTLCPFEYSLDLASWADFVIGDLNYIFDPTSQLKRFATDDRTGKVILLDEAHQLIERGREMYSAEIDEIFLMSLRREIKTLFPQLFRNIGKILSRLRSLPSTIDKKIDCETTEKESPTEIIKLARKTVASIEKKLLHKPELAQNTPLRDIYFYLTDFIKRAERFDKTFCTIVKREKKRHHLKLFCMDPAGLLGKTIAKSRSTIAFSATIHPIHMFCRLSGLREKTSQLRLPSPFLSSNFKVLTHPLPLTFKRRKESMPGIVQLINQLLDQNNRNTIFYFPSFALMNLVLDQLHLQNSSPERVFVIQKNDMSEESRSEFLQTFSNTGHQSIGFAVTGGLFAEGVDLPGQALQMVILFTVGLPALNIERTQLKKYFDENGEDGFFFSYIYHGMARTLQAAGRVIRDEKDRGISILVDERFSRHPYRSLLPAYWDLSHKKTIEQICAEVTTFPFE